MLGPIHAGGDQGNGRRVHQMNGPLELPGESFARFPTDKARRQIPQVFEHGPEELLRQVGRADFTGVGQVIATGRGGAPQTGQRIRM